MIAGFSLWAAILNSYQLLQWYTSLLLANALLDLSCDTAADQQQAAADTTSDSGSHDDAGLSSLADAARPLIGVLAVTAIMGLLLPWLGWCGMLSSSACPSKLNFCSHHASLSVLDFASCALTPENEPVIGTLSGVLAALT